MWNFVNLTLAFPKMKFISLCDILWADLSSNAITVNFVQHTKSFIETKNLTFCLTHNDLEGPARFFAATFYLAL